MNTKSLPTNHLKKNYVTPIKQFFRPKLKHNRVNHIVYTLIPQWKQWKIMSWVMKIDNANTFGETIQLHIHTIIL